MPQRRITVEEVLEASRKRRVKIAHGPAIGEGYRSGCPLGVLYADSGERKLGVYSWADREFGQEYRREFTNGFDGAPVWNILRQSIGHADGTAVREAVFGKQGA